MISEPKPSKAPPKSWDNRAVSRSNGEEYQALDDNVIVRLDEAATRTKGGLLLPDQVVAQPFRGTVVSVGPGFLLDSGERVPPAVEVGDEVIFVQQCSFDFGAPAEERLRIVRAKDIFVKVVK